MRNIQILIVDDHRLFREGLKGLLENLPFVGCVDEAENGVDCIIKLRNSAPDIVFMDIEMPEMDGIEATRRVVELYPDIRIIALSMYGDENYYTGMITAGAKGFVLKNSGFQDVENAIINVLEGNNFISQEILNCLIRGFGVKNKPKQLCDLTEREVEVLYHICKGLSNQEIANVLFLSKRTVDKHRENILSKVGVKNTAGLVIYAVKNGIVEV